MGRVRNYHAKMGRVRNYRAKMGRGKTKTKTNTNLKKKPTKIKNIFQIKTGKKNFHSKINVSFDNYFEKRPAKERFKFLKINVYT